MINKKTSIVNGGDGLPDWMQFSVTLGMFGMLSWILYLLFHLPLVGTVPVRTTVHVL